MKTAVKLLISVCALAMTIQTAGAQAVDSLLATMTLRQKVAQLFVPTVGSQENPEKVARYESWIKEGVGGMIIMDGRLVPCIDQINRLQAKAAIPMLISIDGEWGASMRFPEFPYFPRQMQLGALQDEELVYKMGIAVGKEMKLIHVGANYAPDVDINCNPANPVINTRSFGEDREKVARYGWAYARGMQEQGIAACLKHFPGHGDTSVDSHRGLPVLEFSRERLDSLELYPFRYCIDQGVQMVMLGHLSVPALDPTGIPTSISKQVVTGLLREQMGFKGLIVTDALGMDGVEAYFDGDGPQTALAAYKAGADMLVMPHDLTGCIDIICKGIESGELSEAELDEHVRRILSLKEAQGLLSPDYVNFVPLEGLVEAADSEEDKALIAEISRKTSVLVHRKWPFRRLRKCSRKVAYLALGAGEEKRVITMDEAAGFYNPEVPKGGKGGPGEYSSRRGVGEPGASVFAQTLCETVKADTFFLHRNFTLDELKEMKEQMKGYKTVILGFHDTDTRPQNNYGIKDPSIYDYIGQWAKEQKLIGVYCGSPYALDVMPWYKDFKAFVIAWADNKYNCRAAAEALTGRIKWSGVLPVRAGGKRAGYKAR